MDQFPKEQRAVSERRGLGVSLRTTAIKGAGKERESVNLIVDGECNLTEVDV